LLPHAHRLLPERFAMRGWLLVCLLHFFHRLSLSLVAQLVSVDSGQPQVSPGRDPLKLRKAAG
jgi:hypothetical protein